MGYLAKVRQETWNFQVSLKKFPPTNSFQGSEGGSSQMHIKKPPDLIQVWH